MCPDRSLLLLGCGNEVAGDDSVGSELVQLLASVAPPRGVRMALLSRPGVHMLDTLDREDRIVFADAIVSGRAPGTIVVAPLMTPGIRMRSSVAGEGWGVPDVFALARSLGRHIPHATILGIEVGQTERSYLLSDPVAQAIDYAVGHFDELVESFQTRETVVIEPWEACVHA